MAHRKPAAGEKPLHWVGTSKRDLMAFPALVLNEIGTALSVAQFGGKHPRSKSWKGEGPGVFEIVVDYRGETYRAAYTVRFPRALYVLHAFQKKSPSGIKTARTDVQMIGQRLRAAAEDYGVRYASAKN